MDTLKQIKSEKEGVIKIKGKKYTKTLISPIHTQDRLEPYTISLMPFPFKGYDEDKKNLETLSKFIGGKMIGALLAI